MNKERILSICIPTYNRSNFLEQLLDSIEKEITEKNKDSIEICISDNASTDDTQYVVKKFSDKLDIRYSRNAVNIGPDLNYLNCVRIASGKYCWLMGSDDKVSKNSLDYLLNEFVNDEISIFLSNRINCSYEMNPLANESFVEKIVLGTIIDFNIQDEVISYLGRCNSIGAIFSYLSSIVVKRENWDQIIYDNNFTGTAYSHVYILLSILFQGKKLKYLFKPIVLNRMGNDSFHINLKQRVLLDYKGYIKLSDSIIQEEIIKGCIYSILRKEHTNKTLIKIAMLQKFEKDEILILKKIGYTKSFIFLLKELSRYSFFLKKYFELKDACKEY